MQPTAAPPTWADGFVGSLRSWQQDGGLRQLLRYGAVGVTCTVVYSLLYLVLGPLGLVRANIVSSVASTALGSELHRRVTFTAGARVRWFTAQWQSLGVALVGLVVTTGVLALIEVLAPGSAWWEGLLLVNAATTLVGLGRYVVLRSWVFA